MIQETITIRVHAERDPEDPRYFQFFEIVKTQQGITLKERSSRFNGTSEGSWKRDDLDSVIDAIIQRIERTAFVVTGEVDISGACLCTKDRLIFSPYNFRYSPKKALLECGVYIGSANWNNDSYPQQRIELTDLENLPIVLEMMEITRKLIKSMRLDEPEKLKEFKIQRIGTQSDPWFKLPDQQL